MRPSLKMYLIILIGGCVLLYQYHLSNTWVVGSTVNLGSFRTPDVSRRSADQSGDVSFNQFLRYEVEKIQKVLTNASNGDKNLFWYLTRKLSDYIPASASSIKENFPFTAPPPLYIITPTYRRSEQVPELTRMSHTLMLVPNVHWLVIEDADQPTSLVTELLEHSGIPFSHLVAPMPEKFKNKKGVKPRGVSNRNRGLTWLRANATEGVFYFADDDNTYDLTVFEEMRHTNKVSMWPVGLITKLGVSSPIVRNGKFDGFYDGWMAGRKFPVDMAGFAVSVKFLLERPKAEMPFKPGYEEDGFLKSLAPFEPKEIELLASNCTKVLVWHTQTKKNDKSKPLDMAKYNNTNLVMLKKIIV